MREVPRVHNHFADSSMEGEGGNYEFSVGKPSRVVESIHG